MIMINKITSFPIIDFCKQSIINALNSKAPIFAVLNDKNDRSIHSVIITEYDPNTNEITIADSLIGGLRKMTYSTDKFIYMKKIEGFKDKKEFEKYTRDEDWIKD